MKIVENKLKDWRMPIIWLNPRTGLFGQIIRGSSNEAVGYGWCVEEVIDGRQERVGHQNS